MAVRSADRLTAYERRTSTPLLLASVLLLALLLLPLLVAVDGPAGTALGVLSGALYAVFVVDYAVRLVLAPDRWRFVLTHPVELLLVLLPALRPLRVLLVVLLVERRVARSLHSRTAVTVVVSVGTLLLGAAAAVLQAERGAPGAVIGTYPDALWWAATTASTVGYGDLYPVTAVGRLVAVVVMVLGISLLGVLTASIAAAFVDRALEEDAQADEAADARTLAAVEALTAEVRELRARLDARG